MEMGNEHNKAPQTEENYQLKPAEKKLIDYKVDFEIIKSHFKMILLGGITNLISGLVVIGILYEEVPLSALLSWYGILVILNVFNVTWARRYVSDNLQLEQLKNWRKVFHVVFALICLTWGSMSIFFAPTNLQYQIYIMAFLLAVLIGFTFASITDFALAIVSICCLILPSILYFLYMGFTTQLTHMDQNLHIGIGTSLLILGFFLIIVSRFGSRLVRTFFRLSFTNEALSQKLETINKSLEQRVKERTLELEKLLEEVSYSATHDMLTKLPNHQSLISYMKSAIKLARRNNHMFAVVFFSINELDRVYNALGYQAGDKILKTVAERFKEIYNEPPLDNIENFNYIVTVSRNDRFVILIQPLFEFNLDELEEKISPLFTILEKAVLTEKQVIKLTASIGVSLFPRNGRNTTSLLMNADAAMLLAKQSGGNDIKMYKSEINAAITKQLELESKLHIALMKSEFIIQYQPIIDLKTKAITGAEALVRWENPTLGRISPDNFIPLAEANGIIIPLGEWVFQEACKQIKLWQRQGFSDLKIAVNLSAKQLQSKNFVRDFAHLTENLHLHPGYVEFELTETTAFRKDVGHIMLDLKERGFRLSIDDFGTGYSGLSNIKLFSIDKLKIDKSFIQDLPHSKDCQAIVSNTISLAKGIGITVVAEGVETKEQLDFLLAHDCDMVQGYYFSPPVDPEVFTELLRNQTDI